MPELAQHVDDWLLIGRVVSVFGLRGEVKIDPLTDFPQRFEKLEDAYLGPSKQRLRFVRVRRQKNQFVAAVAGVETVTDAEKLRGADIFVPRSASIPLPEGHYYLSDMLGVEVRTVDGGVVGTIHDVLRTGSNDVFVVGASRGEVLVPSVRDAVRKLDVDGRYIVVESWALEDPV